MILTARDITLACNLTQVAALHQFVMQVCNDLHIDRHVASQLDLALEEAVVNVINYAYNAPDAADATVQVQAQCDGKALQFTVIDSGKPFDPTLVPDTDITLDAASRPVGGLGIHIVRHSVDQMAYSRENGKNVLKLTKLIAN